MTDTERILSDTDNGLKVFKHYLGSRYSKKVFCNPYRGDVSPSCKLYYKSKNGSSRWVMIDFGDSDWTGDCFHLVAKVNHLSLKTQFREILLIINKELDLHVMNELPHVDYKHYDIPDENVSSRSHGELIGYDITYKSYSDYELRWWSRYGITEDILKEYHTLSVRDITLSYKDGHFFTISSDYKESCYAYLFNEGKGVKVYRPGSSTRFLQLGDLPRPYIFGMEQLPRRGDKVFITGGEKDVMSLAAHGFPAVCLNSETAKISNNTLSELCMRFMNIYVLYDCDKTGVSSGSQRIREIHDYFSSIGKNDRSKLVTLPLKGTKSEKDISDFFRLGYTDNDFLKLL